MKKNNKVIKPIFAIVLGLIIEVILKSLVTLITTLISIYAVKNLSPIALNDFYRSPAITLLNVVTISLSLGSIVLAGVIAGYITKSNGIKFGIVIGIVNVVFMLLVVLLPIILPHMFYGELYANPVIKQNSFYSFLKTLREIPLVFILAVFGGFIGNKIGNNK